MPLAPDTSPAAPYEVKLYVCGITPYDAAHLGHAAVYVTYDVLQRRLVDRGHEIRCVRNITDVDDSILQKARELGVHYLDLAATEIARFDDDMAAIGLRTGSGITVGVRGQLMGVHWGLGLNAALLAVGAVAAGLYARRSLPA